MNIPKQDLNLGGKANPWFFFTLSCPTAGKKYSLDLDDF